MRLSESIIFEAIPAERIDCESGIVRGVRILGSVSRNRRRYSDKAMEDASRLYEGVGVKLDHPDRSKPSADRSVLEGFGVLRNVRVSTDRTCVHADHHFPTSDSFAGKYVEYCQKFPNQLGFSHNAEGQTKRVNGEELVESITDVYSVDLVDRPATNRGLFESRDETMTTTLREVLEANPDGGEVRQLLQEAMDAGTVAPDLAMDMEDAQGPDAIKSAFRQAVMAVFDDESMDAKATVNAIKDIMKTADKISGKDKPADDDSDSEPESEADMGGDAAATTESLRAELADLKAENNVRRLLESYPVIESDDALIESLKVLTADQRKALLERLAAPAKNQPGPERPRRTKPLSESTNSNPQYADRWKKAVEATAK